jgi:hypothetical protein
MSAIGQKRTFPCNVLATFATNGHSAVSNQLFFVPSSVNALICLRDDVGKSKMALSKLPRR